MKDSDFTRKTLSDRDMQRDVLTVYLLTGAMKL